MRNRACLCATRRRVQRPEGYDEWGPNTHVYDTAASGYAIATITLPLGGFDQRADASARRHRPGKYAGDHVRTTVDQDIVLRWVPMGNSRTVQRAKGDWSDKARRGTILDVQ